jgi:hypothetical protein
MYHKNTHSLSPRDASLRCTQGYEDFIKDISQIIPVIRVNWMEFRTPEETAEKIKEEYMKMQNIRMVDFAVAKST